MEEWTQFSVCGECVRGILHHPPGDSPNNGIGVLFLHGWSGCKLGPHRMFVKAARALAGAGCTCLRIDFRGRGDSDDPSEEAGIRSMTDDACAAVRHLQDSTGVRRIVVLGICSGGKVAVSTASREPAVRHLVLWSAEALAPLRDSGTRGRKQAHVLRQYAIKALNPQTWKKLLSGRANLGLVRQAVLQQEQPDDQECRDEAQTLRTFAAYSGDVLFIYGANDPETLSSAQGYRRFCSQRGIPNQFHEIPEANHSFYSLEWEREVIDLTTRWTVSRGIMSPPDGEQLP